MNVKKILSASLWLCMIIACMNFVGSAEKAEADTLSNEPQANLEETFISQDKTDENTDEADESADETDVSDDETDESTDDVDVSDDETDESADEVDVSDDETDESADEVDVSDDETDESADETDASDDETDESADEVDVSDDNADESTEDTDVTLSGEAEYKAYIDSRGFATIAKAVAAAEDEDTVVIVPGIYDLTDSSTGESLNLAINKSITIKAEYSAKDENTTMGNTTELKNVNFLPADGTTVVLDGLKITGDSIIDVSYINSDITVKNCYVDVQLTDKKHNLGRSAFIAADNNPSARLRMTIENNTIIVTSSADVYAAAIFTWVPISGENIIRNNVFGSEDARYKFIVVKSINAAADAKVIAEDNIAYCDDSLFNVYAFDMCTMNTDSNEYTLISRRNKIDIVEDDSNDYGVYLVCIESTNLVAYDNGSTIGGVPVILDDFYADKPGKIYGCNVVTDNDEKIISGTLKINISDDDFEAYLSSGASFSTEDGVTTTLTLTDKITVKFELLDEGNPREYGIYLEAEENKIINRFMSAELAFILDGDSLSYTVTPAKDISLLGRTINGISGYEFNLTGKTSSGEKASITANKILLGTVNFDGYNDSPASFGVNSSYTANTVNTAKISDNVVYEYNPSKTGAGNLEVESGKLDNLVFELTKRDVTVFINFSNSLMAGNTADYNDFTVTLTGVNGEVHKGYVGSGEDGNYDSDYRKYSSSLTFNVTAGIKYLVELKGAGYRTFRYSVLVTAEETQPLKLNFWNNAKKIAAEIQEGVSDSQETTTFLAGDIVMDDKINIYDLSAVVSYFGCEITAENAHKYKKYDLNRDGCIDSRDVAYVMVSWGY